MTIRLFSLNSCLIACLLATAPLAAAESQAPAELQADWDKRITQASALQREGSQRQAEAEKLFEQSQSDCYKKFLVNSCIGDARKVYTKSHNEARLLENEGKAIERQVKKEQLSDSDLRRAAQAPQREADLQAREAETSALSKASAEEQAAQEADKVRKAAEGSKRKAADAERLAKKQAEHEAKVTAHKEKAARRSAEEAAK
jgi:colicin import membrane protein